MSESKESSEQLITQWNVQRLVMPHPPCFYTKRCICLSEIGPHSFYVTKCCQQPMHRKCFFNLIDEGASGNESAQVCPFCRSVEFVDKKCGDDYLEHELDLLGDWNVVTAKFLAAFNLPQSPV